MGVGVGGRVSGRGVGEGECWGGGEGENKRSLRHSILPLAGPPKVEIWSEPSKKVQFWAGISSDLSETGIL